MTPQIAPPLAAFCLTAQEQRGFADFAAWDGLLAKRNGATVFAGPAVQRAHAAAFPPDQPIRYLTLRHGTDLQSIWPLWHRPLRRGGMAVREIGFARNAHTLRNHLLLPPDRAVEALTAMLLACKSIPGWDSLVFDNLPDSDSALVQQAARAAGLPCDAASPGRRLLFADISAGMTEYLTTRSGQFRRQLRKRDRDFFALGQARIEALTAGDILEALPKWRALTAKSWQGETDTAVTAADWAFHTALANNGRLWLLSLNGHAVAALRMLEDSHTAYVHTMHYDQGFAEHAPGVVLFAAMMANAAERGLKRVDFNGNTAFFARWATSETMHQNWRLYRPGMLGAAFRIARAGANWMRPAVAKETP